MVRIFALALLTIFAVNNAHAAGDLLSKERVTFASKEAEKVFNTTADSPKDIFAKYRPGLDSSTKIVRPLVVSGSRQNPRVQVSVEKCVAFICQTVDLDASVTIRETRGRCGANYVMIADLGRSSRLLTEVYSDLQVSICFNHSDKNGTLDLVASATHAPTYSTGIVQEQIYNMLLLQVNPIISALNATLKENGASRH